MSKKDAIVKELEAGNVAAACKIARKFFFGLTKEEKRVVEITADCANPKRTKFYRNIGVDTVEALNKAKAILRAKYLI